jgi:hypothetical protein
VTVEEPLDRIVHITAGLAEERRRDREESRQLWRDTQRQIGELAVRMNDLALRVNDLTIKVAETNDAITRLADESREQDKRFGDRVDSLVSAIGEVLRRKDSGQ